MSGLQGIGVVFRKEVTDNLRDRRSIISALMSTLIGPVLTVILVIVLGKTLFTEALEKPLLLPVVGADKAPRLMEFLQQNNVQIQPAPEDPEEAVRQGDLSLVLVVSDDYAEDFSKGRPAGLQMVVDSSRTSSMPDVERARTLIDAYSSQIGALRLIARGVSPSITHPISTERVDVATPQSQVLVFLNMMPYFIVLVVFTGGMYVIIDATAGERERGSLEPLLINPVLRRNFVLGKLAASFLFAVFAVFINRKQLRAGMTVTISAQAGFCSLAPIISSHSESPNSAINPSG
jgi:sodium transport system permease protein